MADGSKNEPNDMTIPVIEIVPGWAADDVHTIEDCEDAHIKCMALAAEIEFHIDLFEAKPENNRDYAWLARAKRALKYKKLAAQIVSHCRGRITKQAKRDAEKAFDRRLLNLIKLRDPVLFADCSRTVAAETTGQDDA